jgi:hypothetical protein
MVSIIWRAVLAMLITLVAATPGRAQQTFTSNSIFSQQGLSVWNSGPAFTLDTGNQFLGESWDLGKTFGGIDCFLGACLGAEIGAETTGKVGVDYSLKVNSGSFDLLYPGTTSITTPTAVQIQPGGLPGVVTLGTQFTGVPSLPTNSSGGTAQATLQVTSPTVQAAVRLEAQASAFAGAKVCVGLCYGPALGPFSVDGSQDLLKINPNNDGTLTVLGNTVSANQNVSTLGGLVNASVQIPNLDGSSAATPGGVSGGVLTSTKRDNIAAVNANIAQIAADAVGLPIPLSGNFGPFGYNLLQSNAGVALDVSQSLQLTPTTAGKLLFSAPVTPDVNGVLGPLTREIDFNYGDDVSFLPGDLHEVSFTPVTDLIGNLHNTTDLVVDGNVNVKALGVDIAGLSVGPLIDATLPPTDIGSINLVDQTFTDNIGAVEGTPITLDFDCGTITGSGEFRYEQVCGSSKIVDLGPVITIGPIMIDEYVAENCAPYSYQIGFGNPPGPPSCTTVFDHFGSEYVDTPDGEIDVSNLDALSFSLLDPGASTTDAGEIALLASLGYTGPASSFNIPEGAPLDSFAVPEPSSMLIFAPAAAFLLRLRRGRADNRRPALV